ncbi:MAG TPA: TlpA disulfide reductase family protein [Candidatus Limnocylindrales bacterium]|nr:TlpA disulfide reductase family protein [Candidatus Limnocylindrales bacterium]
MAATALVIAIVRLTGAGPADTQPIARDQPAPDIVGMTLDGAAFRLADLRGRPVIVNFWGPSCVPCRDEFPLFKAKLAEHAPDRLAIVGVLMNDPPEPARDFVAQFGATWPTVLDPDEKIESAYRVAARPQTYFIDADGILRAIQIGEVSEVVFERQYATIRP